MYPKRRSTLPIFNFQEKVQVVPPTCLEIHEVVADTPHHRVGKGFMTFQGPVAPLPFPMLVKDKEYAVDTTHCVIRDADFDEWSEYETDPLGDFGLHDMIRVCCISIPFVLFQLLSSLFNPFILFISFWHIFVPFLSGFGEDASFANPLCFSRGID